MKNIKKFGKMISILCIIFLVKKLYDLSDSIDFSIIFTTSPLFILFIFFICIISVCLYPIIWKFYFNFFQAQKITYLDLSYFILKTNLGKYLPGNVMHYVSRTYLASRYGLQTIDMIICAFLEILFSIAASIFIFSINVQGIHIFIPIFTEGFFIIFVISCVIGLILIHFFKKIFLDIFLKYKTTFISTDFLRLSLKSVLFYVFNYILTGLVFVCVIIMVNPNLETTASNVNKIICMWSISSLVGMITPGASGGIGVRESALLILLGNDLEQNIIILSAVFTRFIFILSEFFSYMIFMIFTHLLVYYRNIQNNDPST